MSDLFDNVDDQFYFETFGSEEELTADNLSIWQKMITSNVKAKK